VLGDLDKLKKKYSIKEEDLKAISDSYSEEIDLLQYEIKSLKNKLVLYKKCVEIFKKSSDSINQTIDQIFSEGKNE